MRSHSQTLYLHGTTTCRPDPRDLTSVLTKYPLRYFGNQTPFSPESWLPCLKSEAVELELLSVVISPLHWWQKHEGPRPQPPAGTHCSSYRGSIPGCRTPRYSRAQGCSSSQACSPEAPPGTVRASLALSGVKTIF